jgi:hypothetical protein
MNLESSLFAGQVEKLLRCGYLRSLGRDFYQITGGIVSELTIAPVEIWVSQYALRREAPTVWCRESWMRDDVDWHNDEKLGMCWVLKRQWADEMDRADVQPVQLLHFGVNWLLTAAAQLIDRHYHGHARNMTKWPKEWKQFKHVGAKQQYERQPGRRTELKWSHPVQHIGYAEMDS